MTKEYKGVPEELWVRVSKKLSNDNYGSDGVEAELKVNLANVKDLNLDDTFDAVDAWLTAAVARSMEAKTAPESQVNAQQAATVAQTPPPAASNIAATPPSVAPAQISADPTYTVLKNPHIARTEDGRAKILIFNVISSGDDERKSVTKRILYAKFSKEGFTRTQLLGYSIILISVRNRKNG